MIPAAIGIAGRMFSGILALTGKPSKMKAGFQKAGRLKKVGRKSNKSRDLSYLQLQLDGC